ncbi:DUF1631 domain-containing protein [Methylohalobius crimeensis]|uniref:DUF1631 domain-containing protein n=1 Tax=Methylohalobius crimeensis TaxID=244365 RepID=UPI0003B2FCF8|nr:DUF1631 domain-containing protein [Methylohalobius crimeensis]
MQAASVSAAGVLPRYIDLAHRCREQVVKDFSVRFHDFLEELPQILLQLADQAESNVFQAHCMDVRQEVREHRRSMAQDFLNELMAGFERFILGHANPPPNTSDASSTERHKLSLVEKESFEIELAFDTVVGSACTHLSESLFTLDHRLAVINGGFKPGERNAALPGGPRHVCDAFRAALATLQIPVDTGVKISLIEAFDDQVIQKAEGIYQQYNRSLIEAGILPNLEEHPVYAPSTNSERDTAREQAPTVTEAPEKEDSATESATSETERSPAADGIPTDTREEIHEQGIFQNISDLLRQRRGPAAQAADSAGAGRDLGQLMDALKTLRSDNNGRPGTVPTNIAQQPLEQIRAEFAAQLSQLARLIQQHQVSHTDADVIELVGMLFEQVLNDSNLPDSVKALLSHLHTPYLKLALVDREFFFKRRHPARRLLNTLTRAGALCNATEKNEQVVYTRMRETVDRILTEFDDNVELFDHLLSEFETFLETFRQRARMLEKRAIEKAKGQERLREARQHVARQLVQAVRGQSLPKAAEKLLFGPWANLLVLLYLRKSEDNETRQYYLDLTREIIWSVQPKTTSAEQSELRRRLPALQQSIQKGLALLGDPENRSDRLLEELRCCQEVAFVSDGDSWELPEPQEAIDPGHYPLLQDLSPEVLPGRNASSNESSPDLEGLTRRLRKLKLGTWFEFEDAETGRPFRAKLSWYSPKTGYTIFVNQAGVQVAVKSLTKLAEEMLACQTRQLEWDKRPFVERAIQRIYALLGGANQVG